MKYIKVFLEDEPNLFYWTWQDIYFMPYGWLEKKDLKKLPVPFLMEEIHPDCPIGFESDEEDAVSNIIELPEKFEEIKIDSDLKKDLKRIEKKNSDTRIVLNEKNALNKSKKWFLELWKEEKKEFKRRLYLWKKKAFTLSAYSGEELLGVHIALQEKDTVFYLGCWWNREHKNKCIPTFLLKKDVENSIQNKMKYYDLGIGDEKYKKNWNPIEKPTKYYAVLTKEIAEKLGIEKFIETK
ncbi:GNAT family N-acetyltransferase [Candidatus Micrarchaeota archaeon]|nr:GNAT family N-acetyltransferase [Candidatus Micrarchaeota archaeon]MBU2475843.1 GNAT family N-acetyltransferase [Candidatus Micrarchaeota archaeon]